MIIKLNDGETLTVASNPIHGKAYTFMMVGKELMVREFLLPLKK